jgi:hypothetical protein
MIRPLLSMAAWVGAIAGPSASAAPPAYQAFLERHCLECHDADAAKGDLDLTRLSTDGSNASDHRRWVRVFDRVTSGEMPPAKQPRPKQVEKNEFLAALGQDLTLQHAKHKGTVLRRLNRREYQNSIDAVLGIDSEVMEWLPEDGRAQGFDTVGEALSVSDVQMQRYMEAAEAALDAALLQDRKPETLRQRFTLDSERNRAHIGKHWLQRADGAIVVFDDGYFPSAEIPGFRAPARGEYKVTINGYGYQVTRPVIFALVITNPAVRGETTIHSFHELPPAQASAVSVTVPLAAGEALRINPQGLTGPSGQSPIKNGPDRYQGQGLALLEFIIEGPVVEEWPSKGRKLLLGASPVVRVETGRPPARGRRSAPPSFRVDSADPMADFRRNLPSFLQVLFRRPVAAADLEPSLQLFAAEFERSQDYLEAVRTAAIAALCSPEFLFLPEPPGPLGEYTLASRLSYFLTRGPPDAELLGLAANGQLTKPDVLRTQTDRLLDGPHHERFVADFTDGWLNLREIDFTTPDKQLYPEYDDLLRDSMLRETRVFISELIKNNLSVANLIKSDFAMLNGRLASHYSIPGVEGLAIRKVALPPDSKRGGLLTQASVLKVSANGTNTSPVVRGVWVMNRLLGTELPPPPPGVTAIEPDIRGATTIRDQLEKHRHSASCNSCHRIIDPPGFAMENYDVIGGWRHRFRSLENGDPARLTLNGRRVRYLLGPMVDGTGELASGKPFRNMPEFQKLLLDQQDQVARCVIEKILTFATGREMGFSDRELIDRLTTAIEPDGYRFRDLIHAAVQSDIFRTK